MTECLLLTIAAEGILILIFTRRVKNLYYSVLCNLMTNPLLNAIMLAAGGMAVTRAQSYIILAFLELAAVAAEAVCYKHLCGWSGRRALGASFALNAASFLFGVLILW